jgi:hypothetical protein
LKKGEQESGASLQSTWCTAKDRSVMLKRLENSQVRTLRDFQNVDQEKADELLAATRDDEHEREEQLVVVVARAMTLSVMEMMNWIFVSGEMDHKMLDDVRANRSLVLVWWELSRRGL